MASAAAFLLTVVELAGHYDDGGISGGTLERPALKRLLADIEEDRVDVVVVYKIDRLSRALMDFAKLVEVFDSNNVTFVSVTQSFNTTTSMGRLTLNILLSFAQFEREVIGERIRDKVAASRKRGIWMGGYQTDARHTARHGVQAAVPVHHQPGLPVKIVHITRDGFKRGAHCQRQA